MGRKRTKDQGSMRNQGSMLKDGDQVTEATPAEFGPEESIPIEYIDREDRLNPRKNYGDLTGIAAMMKARPTEYDPLWLIKNPEYSGNVEESPMYLMIRGGRRYKAALINEMKEVRAKLYSGTLEDALILAGVDNERPIRLSSYERAGWLMGILTRKKLTPASLADFLEQGHGVKYSISGLYQIQGAWDKLHPKIKEGPWKEGNPALTDELIAHLLPCKANEQLRIWQLVEAGADWRTLTREKASNRGRPAKTVDHWGSTVFAYSALSAITNNQEIGRLVPPKARTVIEAVLRFMYGSSNVLVLEGKPLAMRRPDGVTWNIGANRGTVAKAFKVQQKKTKLDEQRAKDTERQRKAYAAKLNAKPKK